MSDEIITKIGDALVLISMGGVFCAINVICKGFMVFVIGRRFEKPRDVIKLAQVIFHAPQNGALSKYKAVLGGKSPNQSQENPEITK